MTMTAGVDVGTGAVKAVLFDIADGNFDWIGKVTERIRRRDPTKLAEETYLGLLAEHGIPESDIAYVATTGEGESVPFRTGHFYSMTTHARGGIFLDGEARAVLDVGALHGRAINIDEHGKVLSYRMTSQCASGSGQFLENIARYLGVAADEIGELSLQADDPEAVSTICAVLAETDVINMVSRGISTPNILRGIHNSMATRLAKLLKAGKISGGKVLVTGGLALDTGLIGALVEQLEDRDLGVSVATHADAIYAGAIGAAIWGEFRHRKLAQLDQLAKAS